MSHTPPTNGSFHEKSWQMSHSFVEVEPLFTVGGVTAATTFAARLQVVRNAGHQQALCHPCFVGNVA